MSLMASFMLSFFLRDVLDEIWDFIKSVSEGFPTYLLSYEMHVYPEIRIYNNYGNGHV